MIFLCEPPRMRYNALDMRPIRRCIMRRSKCFFDMWQKQIFTPAVALKNVICDKTWYHLHTLFSESMQFFFFKTIGMHESFMNPYNLIGRHIVHSSPQ